MEHFIKVLPFRIIPAEFNAPPEFLAGFASEPSPIIYFEEMEHDFGKVSEGRPLTHTFNFTNRGEGMLEIKGIKPG